MESGTADILKARPCRNVSCIVEQQCSAENVPAHVLKDASGARYIRLSDEGLFLWQLMDGNRTIGDLCRAYVERYQQPPDVVMRAMARLVGNGFVAIEGLPGPTSESARRSRGLHGLLGLTTCYWWLSDVDGAVTALHAFVRPLYARWVQLVLLMCTVAGAVAFAHHWMQPGATAAAAQSALPMWLAGLALHVLIHEAAHAVTCKHFGRAVHRVGVGWYYFAPVAFVDTSDCWAAPRCARILVSAAGPYSNLVLGGLAALAAMAQPAGPLPEALWSFASIGYVLALVNMNPLLELDGYYVAMDQLELPDLRSRALASLAAALRGHRAGSEQHQISGILTAFGAASLAYGLMIVVAILVAGRAEVESLAALSMPHAAAQAFAWTASGLMGLLALNRVLTDLLKGRRDQPSCP